MQPEASRQHKGARRRRRARLAALCALLFPLIFLAVVVAGVASMHFERLASFRAVLGHPDAAQRSTR